MANGLRSHAIRICLEQGRLILQVAKSAQESNSDRSRSQNQHRKYQHQNSIQSYVGAGTQGLSEAFGIFNTYRERPNTGKMPRRNIRRPFCCRDNARNRKLRHPNLSKLIRCSPSPSSLTATGDASKIPPSVVRYIRSILNSYVP